MYYKNNYYYINESEIRDLINESLKSSIAKGLAGVGMCTALGYSALMSPDYDYRNDPDYDAEADRQVTYDLHRAERDEARRKEAEAQGEVYKPNYEEDTYEYGMSESIHKSIMNSLQRML